MAVGVGGGGGGGGREVPRGARVAEGVPNKGFVQPGAAVMLPTDAIANILLPALPFEGAIYG
jgi:hypothetical protein